jgi:8-oxo-dGTP pyrophosphatase MutT (NUDIX family)
MTGAPDGAAPPAGRGAPSQPPAWAVRLARSAGGMEVPAGLRPPPGPGRSSAVLILLGCGASGPDVLLVQRSPQLRRHAGQAAFPGGAIEPGDGGPVRAALREAAEETLVDPRGVDVLGLLPELYISRSGFRVWPVLGWWRDPVAVGPGDEAEIAAVARVPLAELADPARRRTFRYPSGEAGPGFLVAGLVVWGFTGFLVDQVLRLGGFEQPWDAARVQELPAGLLGVPQVPGPGA